MLLAHLPKPHLVLRRATPAQPLRVLVSGCMAGEPCGVDATDNGMGGCLADFLALPALTVCTFCPEDVGMGTPRTLPDLHDGDGFAVLVGSARVVDDLGNDCTVAMMQGAAAMLAFAQQQEIELAVLTDMSGACGSQVISAGCRLDAQRKYQVGVGVATAMLLRAGFAVVSQRDFRTLDLIRGYLDPKFPTNPALLDHHQTPWFLQQFGGVSS